MSNNASQQIVNKAWNFAHVLRDDGLSYMAYTEQITFLLFLKMAHEQTLPPYNQPPIVPPALGWGSLLAKDGDDLEVHYRHVLEELGKKRGMLGEIFKKARQEIQNPATLKRLIVDLIEPEQWMLMQADVKGDIYEGLLAKSAAESPKGAGQYFTPRELIKAIVDVMQPKPDDTVCDPACGTGGFLLAAHDYPKVLLQKAVEIAQKIKELNGGNAWTPSQIAEAIGMGPRSPDFYYVTAASRDFELTTGTRDTETIALADLGREIVYAPSLEAERAKKLEAFHKVELFSKVLQHYKGSNLPEMKYLGNTLEREFGLAPQYHEEFSRVFRANCEYLDITSGEGLADQDENTTPTTVVLGEPSKKSSVKAFVIMPFIEKTEDRPKGFFSEVLRSLITPAGIEAGFNVETANRQGSDVIQSTIVNELLEADLVIADLTDHNPNVLFELGLRMAQEKPVALIKAAGTGRVFDVDNMLRVHEYQPQLWRSTVETDLPELVKHIRVAWENRAKDVSYMKILRRSVPKAESGG